MSLLFLRNSVSQRADWFWEKADLTEGQLVHMKNWCYYGEIALQKIWFPKPCGLLDLYNNWIKSYLSITFFSLNITEFFFWKRTFDSYLKIISHEYFFKRALRMYSQPWLNFVEHPVLNWSSDSLQYIFAIRRIFSFWFFRKARIDLFRRQRRKINVSKKT